jgi:hypothetical protein
MCSNPSNYLVVEIILRQGSKTNTHHLVLALESSGGTRTGSHMVPALEVIWYPHWKSSDTCTRTFQKSSGTCTRTFQKPSSTCIRIHLHVPKIAIWYQHPTVIQYQHSHSVPTHSTGIQYQIKNPDF